MDPIVEQLTRLAAEHGYESEADSVEEDFVFVWEGFR